jgi:hypothetical protein
VNAALVRPDPLKLTEFVVNAPHGLDKNHAPLPQLITPSGYSPESGRFGLLRVSNVTVCAPAPTGVDVAVGVGVAVGAAVAVDVGVAVRVGVGLGVGLAVAVGVDVAGCPPPGPPPTITRSSKFVSQPLLLPTVTSRQLAVQPVAIVRRSPPKRNT